MTTDQPILSASERDDLAELITRMKRGEPGLYARRIGPLLMLRRDKGLALQRQRIKHLVERKKLVLWKKTQRVYIFQEIRP